MNFKRKLLLLTVSTGICTTSEASKGKFRYNIRKEAYVDKAKKQSTEEILLPTLPPPLAASDDDYYEDDNYEDTGASLIGLRSGPALNFDFSNFAKKSRGASTCAPLTEFLNDNDEYESLSKYGLVTSCSRQHYKNSNCFIKCQKGFELELGAAKKPVTTCRCRKRRASGDPCNWDGLKELSCKPVIETRSSCRPPAASGTMNILDRWEDGIMTFIDIATEQKQDLTDWTLLIEWNKPVKSKRTFLWNANVEKISKDLTLWTVANKAGAAASVNGVKFGMVVDNLERRDYGTDELSANLFLWNFYNEDAACWSLSEDSILARSAVKEQSTRSELDPVSDERTCFKGKYYNTNIWRHHQSQYRVHASLEFELTDPLGEWEVELVFENSKKMLVLETPQMTKKDKSTDGRYWSFVSKDFNDVIVQKELKFFMSGAMWRSAPAPSTGVDEYETDLGSDPSGEVRICGVKAPWAHIQQRSQAFSTPIYEGKCSKNSSELVESYEFLEEERCQNWSPDSILKTDKDMLRRWNKGQMCNDSEDQTSKYICFSMLYMESQKAGKELNLVPWRGQSTLKDGCDLVDSKFKAPIPVDLSGGFFADDGHVKVTQVNVHIVNSLATMVKNNWSRLADLGVLWEVVGYIKHAAEYLDQARFAGANMVVQVGDARVDDRCSEGSIEASAERRVTLASDRKYPATDALAGTAGALLAAADALEAVDEGDFAERLRRKSENIISSLLKSPQGLSGENANFGEGQLSHIWRSTCFFDELAYSAAWTCTRENDDAKEICFEQVEELLSEADEKCEPSTMSVSWDDLRLSTKYVLARYSGSLTHVKNFVESLNIIANEARPCVGDSIEETTAHASTLALGLNLVEFPRANELTYSPVGFWRRSLIKMLNCVSENMIGFGADKDAALFHKNSKANGAALWGAIVNESGRTKITMNIDFLLAAASL